MNVLQPIVWGPAATASGTLGLNTFPTNLDFLALNDSNNAIAVVFVAPKTGNISAVGVTVVGIAGSPPDYNIALVTLDSSGNPTTTPVGSSEAETLTASGAGHQTVTLNPTAAVTLGDIVAIHVWPTANAPDASNRISVASNQGILDSSSLPRGHEFELAWTAHNGLPIFTVTYDDASIYGCGASAIWGYSFDENTTPDEVGMKITLPCACKCCGAKVNSSYFDANAAWSVCLYNSASTLLASWACADEDAQGGYGNFYYARWAEQALAAGDYYLTVKPSGTGNYGFSGFQFPSAALRAACMIPEAANVVAAYRTNAGAWTTDDTVLPFMGLLLSDITFGGGSAGPRWL